MLGCFDELIINNYLLKLFDKLVDIVGWII